MDHAMGSDFQDASFEALVTLVERMVIESGNPAGFDARAWSLDWATTECNALGGARPLDLLSSTEGHDTVMALVMQMQSGAYA